MSHPFRLSAALVICFVLFAGAGRCWAQRVPADKAGGGLANADLVAIIGDSITEQKMYSQLIAAASRHAVVPVTHTIKVEAQ